MSISIEQFIPSGATLVGTVAGLIGMWFKFQNKVENLEKDRKEDAEVLDRDREEDKEKFDREMQRIKEVNALQWAKIDEAFRWHGTHEKEAWENRNELELKIAAQQGATENLKTMLASIEKKLDSVIERLDK